jgi:hypothetical protein
MLISLLCSYALIFSLVLNTKLHSKAQMNGKQNTENQRKRNQLMGDYRGLKSPTN